jgi:predicted ATP-dependent serine protease
VNPDLFLVSHVESIRLEQVVADAYKFKPRVIIVDSFQLIAEVEKSQRGCMTALSRFKLLKNDPNAGKPHIIFISQLNKKGSLSGSQKIPHMVDFVGKASKVETRKGVFIFECPEKNRGGETQRGAIFRHTETGIECLSTDHNKGPVYKLIQHGPTGTALATPPQPASTGLGQP